MANKSQKENTPNTPITAPGAARTTIRTPGTKPSTVTPPNLPNPPGGRGRELHVVAETNDPAKGFGWLVPRAEANALETHAAVFRPGDAKNYEVTELDVTKPDSETLTVYIRERRA